MVAIERILCAVDCSPYSERALAEAMKIAQWSGSTLTVLHVVPPISESTTGALATVSHTLADTSVRELIGRAQLPGVEVAVEVFEAHDTALQILERADAVDADLIVTGSHGRTGMKRLVLGSVVESLLHRSHRPLLAIPSHVDAVRHAGPMFGRILCAVDFSETSLTAAAHAIALAEEANATLTLLNVIELPPEIAQPPTGPVFDVDRVRANAEASCLFRLEALVPTGARDYCTVETTVFEGGIARQILRAAAAKNIDLIVMGAQGRSALDLAVFGSNTKEVIRHSQCPVLVVPRNPARTASQAA